MANEKRLIDANTLKAKAFADPDSGGAMVYLQDIDEARTVDAVEVVRCRDCKHRYNGKDCTHPLLLSYSWGAIRNVKNDDFCSYGERRQEKTYD